MTTYIHRIGDDYVEDSPAARTAAAIVSAAEQHHATVTAVVAHGDTNMVTQHLEDGDDSATHTLSAATTLTQALARDTHITTDDAHGLVGRVLEELDDDND